jgi:hypothetical protein
MVLLGRDRTIFGSGAPKPSEVEPIKEYHSPLLGGCHGEGLLAIEMVVPSGGTGGGGSRERGSESEVEGGASEFSARGGGRRTLKRRLAEGLEISRSNSGESIALFGGTQWVGGWRLKEAYRGLAERLACDGPAGAAQEGTSQHGDIRPSDQFQMEKGGSR